MFSELIAEARQQWRCAFDVPRSKPPIIEYLADALEQVILSNTDLRNNHTNEVRRARMLKERLDMPIDRVHAYDQWGRDLAELNALRAEVKVLRGRLSASEGTDFC